MKNIFVLLVIIMCVGCCGDFSIEVKRGAVKDCSYLTPFFGQDRTIIKFEDGSIFNIPYMHQIPCRRIKIMKSKSCYIHEIVCINEEVK